ncbi:uncharacterized protein BCR38DRAFT_442131 [Pseudomassariella vexata]|uniref:Uncharacterized protein n=1 Tax=Pseudomassariella vexata TaxID=1141098 RepID=A0A1Y2DN09_9PEZI|nr:uncharacterized protein BCR38DRAFT_442131 [Pseudomassariella vexata]ORY60678.1 hypothetical protein BCR38DRAFT_442131 [Pseudomassariella vexata]
MPLYQAINTEYCEDCQLTWLVGRDTHDIAPQPHPYHNTLFPVLAINHCIDQRSLVVHIGTTVDKKYKGKTDGNKATVVGFGVYFGERSKYNHVDVAYLVNQADHSDIGELYAASAALRLVRKSILTDWKALIEKDGTAVNDDDPSFWDIINQPAASDDNPASKVPSSMDSGEEFIHTPSKLSPLSSEDEQGGKATTVKVTAPEPTIKKSTKKEKKKGDKGKEKAKKKTKNKSDKESVGTMPTTKSEYGSDLRLIIATDSTSLYDIVTDRLGKWKYDGATRQFKTTKSRKPPKNNDLIVDLKDERDALMTLEYDQGIEVAWYKIPQKKNTAARALAQLAIDAFKEG